MPKTDWGDKGWVLVKEGSFLVTRGILAPVKSMEKLPLPSQSQYFLHFFQADFSCVWLEAIFVETVFCMFS